jgi:hypothetical protein
MINGCAGLMMISGCSTTMQDHANGVEPAVSLSIIPVDRLHVAQRR